MLKNFLRKRQIEKENSEIERWKQKYKIAEDCSTMYFHNWCKAEEKLNEQETDLEIMKKQLVLLVTALSVYIEMYGCELSEADRGEGWRLNGNVRTQYEITAVIKAKNIALNYKENRK